MLEEGATKKHGRRSSSRSMPKPAGSKGLGSRRSPRTKQRSESLVLGIDLGTTSVKMCVYSPRTGKTLQAASCVTYAKFTDPNQPPGADEQQSFRIIRAYTACLSSLQARLLGRVNRIGVAGQMHGCVCWRPKSRSETTGDTEPLAMVTASQLVTWQDSRCSQEFIASLPASDSPLSTGYGCATLFWYQRNDPGFLETFAHAGTVMDLLVTTLCGLEAPIMSVQNAASWGYFNLADKQWNKSRLSEAGFPVRLLPEVVEPGTIVGKLKAPFYGIPEGCEVAVGMGDLHCTILSVLQSPNDAVVNIGTSAQLVAAMPPGFDPTCSSHDFNPAVVYYPYFNGQYLAVAASLNGGNTLASLVEWLKKTVREFGFDIPEEDAYKKLIERGMEVRETNLVVCSTFRGERYAPSLRGSIDNLSTDNASIGDISRAMCKGIIKNLHQMMSRKELLDLGVNRIIGSGSALVKNPVLSGELESVFGFPVVYSEDGGDAAKGAAMAVLQ